MEQFLLIYCIVLTLFMIFIVLRLLNTNEKVRRLKKRYDYLLRGRGELNLEELIVEHGRDIDSSTNAVKAMQSRLKGMEDGYGQRIERFESILNRELGEQDKIFEQRTQALEGALRNDIRQVQDMTDKRTASLETDTYQKFAAVDEALTTQREEMQRQMQSVETRAMQELHAVEAKATAELDRVENQTKQDVSRIEKAALAEAHRIEQKEDQSVSELDSRFQAELSKEVLNLNNRLILAIQKVGIYKYNAFENLAGEQSFSIALLDNLNNGVILTSIYGRQQTTTFAKQVENGKALQPISPEETQALEMVIGSKKRS